jgi:DNA-binding MarR family transcriptional regulator
MSIAAHRYDEPLAAWEAFLQAHARVSDELARDLKKERDLELSWYEVLLHLSSAPGRRLRLQDLATRVLYSRSGLTRLVDRLASAGLVTREPCEEDRRGTWALLTPEGLRTFRRAAPTHQRGVEDHFIAKLSDHEIAVITSAMKRIAEHA